MGGRRAKVMEKARVQPPRGRRLFWYHFTKSEGRSKGKDCPYSRNAIAQEEGIVRKNTNSLFLLQSLKLLRHSFRRGDRRLPLLLR